MSQLLIRPLPSDQPILVQNPEALSSVLEIQTLLQDTLSIWEELLCEK